MKSPRFSVVIPCYRSTDSLDDLCARLDTTFQSMAESFEIILIDDASPDNTWQRIEAIRGRFSGKVRGIALSRNFGQHNATLCGFHYVRGEFVITIDDDLQIPPEEISALWKQQRTGDWDLVYGVYEEKHHGLIRNLGSRAIATASRIAFGTTARGSSFRLMKRSLAEKIREFTQGSVYLDGLILWHTHSITNVIVAHHDREVGVSNYSLPKLIAMSGRFLFNYTTLPLSFIVILGGTVSTASFLVGAWFVVHKLFFGAPLGFTAIIVSLSFSTGLILLCMGVIGEYLRRLLLTVSQRPQFSVRSMIE